MQLVYAAANRVTGTLLDTMRPINRHSDVCNDRLTAALFSILTCCLTCPTQIGSEFASKKKSCLAIQQIRSRMLQKMLAGKRNLLGQCECLRSAILQKNMNLDLAVDIRLDQLFQSRLICQVLAK